MTAKLSILQWRAAGVNVSLTDDERDRLKARARRLRTLDMQAMVKQPTDLRPRLRKKTGH